MGPCFDGPETAQGTILTLDEIVTGQTHEADARAAFTSIGASLRGSPSLNVELDAVVDEGNGAGQEGP